MKRNAGSIKFLLFFFWWWPHISLNLWTPFRWKWPYIKSGLVGGPIDPMSSYGDTRHAGHCWMKPRWTHKRCTPYGSPHTCRAICRTCNISTNSPNSAAMWAIQCMLSLNDFLPRAIELIGGVAREGQGYPCCRHDMMMMHDDAILIGQKKKLSVIAAKCKKVLNI